ncbi:hypothetical protein M899_1583 [Bacteriovorax sp. BSW11_IV]|uniref:hypothetical protein n=1 Tax=Bacteriovorax sp. BSW11_IV TaxID=1353529 RepID=UPI00038A1DB6|nr:hypothetical protein [Bacteriovorax sp. BSW11_IV]EQC49496.1 hypothetical protein M899_1583 [Bacteriovorax sp. BSW11_IV]
MPAVLPRPHQSQSKKTTDETEFFNAIMEQMDAENKSETVRFRKEIDTFLTYKKLHNNHIQYLFCFYGAYFTSLSFYSIQGHPGVIAFNEFIVIIGGLFLLWLGFRVSFPHLRHESEIMDYLNSRAHREEGRKVA